MRTLINNHHSFASASANALIVLASSLGEPAVDAFTSQKAVLTAAYSTPRRSGPGSSHAAAGGTFAPPLPPPAPRSGAGRERHGAAPARLRLEEAREAHIDSSAFPYPGVPPSVGSGSIGVRPADPAHHRGGGRHREPRWVPAGWGRGAVLGPRSSFPPASACVPNSTAAARPGPGPEGPLPASRPSRGSAPPSRPPGGGRRAAAQSLVPTPRGRGPRRGARPPHSPRRGNAWGLRPQPRGRASRVPLSRPPRLAPAVCPRPLRGFLRAFLWAAPGKVTFRFVSDTRCVPTGLLACLSPPPPRDMFACVEGEEGECAEGFSPPFFCVTGR